jgi:thioredoxin-dependent peroxiredoxin
MKRIVVAAFAILMMAASASAFTVSTADGSSTFTLADAKGKFVALHFLLKTECPICLKHTRDYAQKSAKLTDVVQVFMKPDADPDLKKWETKLKSSTGITAPPIYQDENAQLAKQFKIPDGYQFHGHSVHYPALVLLGPDGNEVFRYVGKSNMDRFSFEQLEAKVAELKKK